MAGNRARAAFSTREIALLAAAVVAGCLFPLLLGAGGGETEEVRANRERIEAMTELERRQLEQRFARYRELPTDERDRLRSMHTEIEGNADLSRTVAAYRRWVETLSPLEREELRRETDPEAKLALVRRIRGRQQEEEQRSKRRPIEFVSRAWGGPRPPKIDDAVYETVFKTLAERLPSPERARLDDVDGTLARRVAILRLTIDRSRRGSQGRPSKVLDDETVDAVVANLPNGPIKEMIDSAKITEGKRMRLVGLISISLWRDISEEVTRRKPNPDELWKFFSELPAEERNRMTSLSRSELERELTRKYVLRSLGDVEGVLRDLKSALPGGGRPPFGRPPYDGKPPTRRPGDGRPPGEGRPGGGRGRRPGEADEGRDREDRPFSGRRPFGSNPEAEK